MKFLTPSHDELDVTDLFSINEYMSDCYDDIDLIVHCAAFTNVLQAEIDKRTCYDVNVRGTHNLSIIDKPMIYISTEYVFDGSTGNYYPWDVPNPVNYYGLTKLLGEFSLNPEVKNLIIRTLFKPKPFEHPNALTDCWTSGSYVDKIAKEIIIAIKNFKRIPMPCIHIGFERKSIYDLARETKKVGKIQRQDLGVNIPRDTSLNCNIWKNIKGILNGK